MKGMGRWLVVGLLGLALLLACSLAMAQAHHGHHGSSVAAAKGPVCELCGKPLVTARAVTLRAADGKPHHYRCINCALVAARDLFTSDVKLTAQSVSTGKTVQWTRKGGVWSVIPASANVIALPETSGDCLQDHLVFSDDAERLAYTKTHLALAKHSSIPAADVASILSAGKSPLPKQATCPVSGKSIHPTAKTEWTMYQGETYYFCCAACKPKFVADPASYLGETKPEMGEEGCEGHEGGGCSGGCGEHEESSPAGGHTHSKAPRA